MSQSQPRKFLVAKRLSQRPQAKQPNLTSRTSNNNNSPPKRGLKRPPEAPQPVLTTKNLAANRLKRLRITLAEDVVRKSQPVKPPTSRSVLTQGKRHLNQQLSEHNVPHKAARAADGVSPFFKFDSRVLGGGVKFNSSGLPNPFQFARPAPVCTAVSSGGVDKYDEVEDMEWSNCDSMDLVRKEISGGPSISQESNSRNCIHVVVDTNIFISHLDVIRDIVKMKTEGPIVPVIFIPWMVNEELDSLKTSNNNQLQKSTRDAINYINHLLESRSDRVRGQTALEANDQASLGKSQDNKIMSCCLQSRKMAPTVLLSNDTNLRNKAHINNIPACSHQEIKYRIRGMLENLIAKCIEQAKVASFVRNPPRTLLQCLKAFKQYWAVAFQEILNRQFKGAVDDLLKFLRGHEYVEDQSPDLKELVRLCTRICIYLKDVEFYDKEAIACRVRELNNIID